MNVSIFKNQHVLFIYDDNVVRRYDIEQVLSKNGQFTIGDSIKISGNYDSDSKGCPFTDITIKHGDDELKISEFTYMDNMDNNIYLYNGKRIYNENGVYKYYLTSQPLLSLDETNLSMFTSIKSESDQAINYGDVNDEYESSNFNKVFNDIIGPFKDIITDDMIKNLNDDIKKQIIEFVKTNRLTKDLKAKLVTEFLPKIFMSSPNVFLDMFKKFGQDGNK